MMTTISQCQSVLRVRWAFVALALLASLVGNPARAEFAHPGVAHSQGSGRDQGHTQMGLEFLANTCETAWIQGVDLYGALDNRLLAGFEYTCSSVTCIRCSVGESYV